MLLVYFTLGEIYLAQGNDSGAIEVLETYVGYETKDATALAMLGEAYYKTDKCDSAIEVLSSAISMDSQQRRAYLYRGSCFLEQEEIDEAEADLKRAYQYFKDDFDLNLSLMRVSMIQEKFGDAYLQGETVLSLAETSNEKALAYYWRAINFEFREEPNNAADSWEELLDLPISGSVRNLRAEAREHLIEIRTPTPSFTPSPTRTPTITPTPSQTPTRTPRATN